MYINISVRVRIQIGETKSVMNVVQQRRRRDTMGLHDDEQFYRTKKYGVVSRTITEKYISTEKNRNDRYLGHKPIKTVTNLKTNIDQCFPIEKYGINKRHARFPII